MTVGVYSKDGSVTKYSRTKHGITIEKGDGTREFRMPPKKKEIQLINIQREKQDGESERRFYQPDREACKRHRAGSRKTGRRILPQWRAI